MKCDRDIGRKAVLSDVKTAFTCTPALRHESRTKRNAFPYLDKHASQALIFTVSNHFTHYKTILKFLILSFFPVTRFLVTSLLCLVTPRRKAAEILCQNLIMRYYVTIFAEIYIFRIWSGFCQSDAIRSRFCKHRSSVKTALLILPVV